MKERPNAARRAWAILAALGITTIFLLTALPSTPAQVAGTIHPTNLSRVTTSGGCSTVTPWGDPLRGCYVTPPSPPALAPDGLAFGAVGLRGAQGQVGAASFAKGTSTILGISPCMTAGCTTVINANSFWGNATVSAKGNITIASGKSLTISNTVVNFTEPPTTRAFAYGINVSYNSVTPIGTFVATHGSLITQTNATSNSLYIWSNCSSVAPQAYFFNTTIRALSPTVLKTEKCIGSSDTLHATTFIGLGWFNYSSFYGSTYSFFMGLHWTFEVNPATNDAFDGGASHSYFNRSSVYVIPSLKSFANDTFDNSAIRLLGYATTHGPFHVGFDTFRNLTLSSLPGIATSIMGGQVKSFTMNRTVVDRSNLTNPSLAQLFPILYGGGIYDVENDTYSNSTVWGSSMSLLANEPVYNVTVHHLTVYNMTVAGNAANEGHLTIVSVSGNSLGNPGIVTAAVGTQTLRFEYNVVNGIHSSYLTESALVGAEDARNYVRSNLFENFIQKTIATPLGSNQVFNAQDNGQQVYSTLAATFPTGSTPAQRGANAVAVFSSNWMINSVGQNFMVQAAFIVSQGGVQVGGDKLSNNTVENLNSAGGVAVALNSGMVGAYVGNTTCYGVYNFSFCYGSNEGASVNGNFTNNAAFDEDKTSFDGWSTDSSTTFYNTIDAVYAQNANNSIPPTGQTTWKNQTSKITWSGSIITTVNLTALVPSTGATQRSVQATDFNLTTLNSYLPASITTVAQALAVKHSGAWSVTTHANPSFLNLTGYLGVFGGQTYTINTSWIKGETTLTLQFVGSPVAIVPTSVAAVNTFNLTDGTHYKVTANRTADGSVPLTFWNLVTGQPYVLTGQAPNGSTFLTRNLLASPVGSLNVTYNPTTMPLTAWFNVTTPPVSPQLFFGLTASSWNGISVILSIVALMLLLVAAERRYRD